MLLIFLLVLSVSRVEVFLSVVGIGVWETRSIGNDWNGKGASDWHEWDNCSGANEGVECVN